MLKQAVPGPGLYAPPNTRWVTALPVMGLSEQGKEALGKLRELSRLPDGWDGQGGPRLREAAKEAAVLLVGKPILAMAPTPHIGPVIGGGIQFEWQVGSRSLEIEVLPDGSSGYLAVSGPDDMQEGEVHEAMLDDLFQWLTRT